MDGLLNAVFGFLQRRTDFFYEMEPGDKMGFPPGVSESMVGIKGDSLIDQKMLSFLRNYSLILDYSKLQSFV